MSTYYITTNQEMERIYLVKAKDEQEARTLVLAGSISTSIKLYEEYDNGTETIIDVELGDQD